MCEYCGCQSVEAVAQLTAEHDAVVNMMGELRTAADQSDLVRVAGLARSIAAVLAPHTAVEEGALFPALRAEFPEHMAALEEEHRVIDAVLMEAADGLPADATWLPRLREAMVLLREHILKEQDGVFPAALISLDVEQWEQLDAVRARVGSALTHDRAAPPEDATRKNELGELVELVEH